MKDKSQLNRPQSKLNLKASTSNLFLNIIIIILGSAIIFMAYSLITKIMSSGDEVVVAENGKPSAIVQVEVLNGCGVTGIADKVTSYMRRNNFDVVQVGNYISYEMDKSLVIDRAGNKANAEKVAEALGIDKKNIVQQINSDYFLDCSIVIGRDYFKLKPYN